MPDSKMSNIVRFVASRAWDHYHAERFDAADLALDLLVEMAPDVAEYWTLRGIVKRKRDQYGVALESLTRAHELAPDDRNTAVNLAEVLCLNDKIREGIELFTEAFNSGYNPDLSPAAQDAVTRRAGFNLAALRRLASARKTIAEAS